MESLGGNGSLGGFSSILTMEERALNSGVYPFSKHEDKSAESPATKRVYAYLK